MKAILEFNMDEPEDVKKHFRCIKAEEMASALFLIVYNLRRDYKHVDFSNAEQNLFDEIFTKIGDIVSPVQDVIDEI